jgi:hypothetical protein
MRAGAFFRNDRASPEHPRPYGVALQVDYVDSDVKERRKIVDVKLSP